MPCKKQQTPAFSGGLGDMANCPTDGGIYVLLARLEQPLTITRPRLAELEPGLYVYVGSAYGPGGLRSRLARHLRPNKPLRWHIDQITTRAETKYAIGWTDGKECELQAALAAGGNITYPLPVFGSSDCRSCPSHLLRIIL
ncbi:GIY-YIG nuclease family protein [Cohaesibacter intestini]|uniref:GIY-YIG nuclease family protein n=1 Tax=Cohaesibacter intestini TaxID=2211145 RepID=UPI0018E572D6|nr:GIY-YIG nuclease family protein [Cohaesibacter intestini]